MTLDRIEEHWNAWTHYIGTLAAIAALVLLIIRAVHFSNVSYLGSVIVFGIALILLYSISGTYHILRPGKAKKIFHVLDHIGIYFLIAASYTPYIFMVLTGPKKWIIFGIQWGITLLGIFFKILFTGRFQLLSTLLYLAMGWTVIFVFRDIYTSLSPLSFGFLLASGVAYSLGTIPFLLDKIRFTHAIWHLFVLAGSTLGFFSVFFLV
ncbi:hemolysin D [Fusobacterium necrophorum subsp. funduliforme]|uniref:Hemolysin D n=1 Tax=Fusobacterium necrophorum subsp. funduliforme TaxID=143387 RepID=A0A162IXQ0_9FUSO|nr:hemolysin III family protein [Fusobacterium necrophorum]AYV92766.1 hemolysin III family protein [Fusobacterium necrophorum subsp. funduliforme]KYL04659.1 hemolysin D [Fusobacterium necrophorum subsp. funduliforme]KYM44310.1 hemolysin D [Fusobacterium necrophorum subsp. funduliforme]KYM62110.1 hemolysin D [Fusobacterium necrophorum subsp. funduliforme]KYM64021.1 hemolysin D [Fusobacterium necrophorum subsp. funduliforme]